MYTIESGREFLKSSDVMFDQDPDDEDYDERLNQCLNLNDTLTWGCADFEFVPNVSLPEVAELFFRYGWCGILYWVNEQRNQCRSEFADINRFVEFVRQEEEIRAEIPDSSTRAYTKRQYTIGEA